MWFYDEGGAFDFVTYAELLAWIQGSPWEVIEMMGNDLTWIKERPAPATKAEEPKAPEPVKKGRGRRIVDKLLGKS